ncbi:MAG: methionine--tRNA ligase [Planctomycetaceae bacterium]
MADSPKKILVTAALPYANGPIHLGHLVEYIQTDIWVRFQNMQGHRCIFLCADDTHGTAIMIRARQENRSEEALIAEMSEAHQRDFAGFQIGFSNYGSTNSEENRQLCHKIWGELRKSGLIAEKDVSQLYDPVAGTFLADRFVKGTCPKCGSADQYGDNCDKCGATYTPADLVNPYSTLTKTAPEVRTAKHLFVELEKLHGFLSEWTQCGKHLQSEVANYLQGHFLQDPLRDWDVSRPAPYFGFEIPDSKDNYWYVWFDAPIGYMASLAQWCKKNNENFDDWWPQGADAQSRGAEIHHFIGKDITYFHTLFWPGMLMASNFKLPERVHIHGFLTMGSGEKMSKTKGTLVRAERYLQHLDPAFLRYYYASKLGPRLDDIELNFEEFVNKINSDLVGKVVNLASRTAKFVEKTGLSATYPDDGGLFANAASAGEEIAKAFDNCDYARAVRLIMELADKANPYIDEQKPWVLAKNPAEASKLQDVCTVGINLFRQIVIYLAPILPKLATDAGELLKDPLTSWSQSQKPLVAHTIGGFSHMMKRVEKKDIEAMVENSKEAAPATETAAATTFTDSDACLQAEPLLTEQISIDEFTKVDLRVARVLEAHEVPEAKKLLRLKLGLGGDVTRQVFAGIKAAYKPEDLVGRLVIMVANLAPRQMKFGLSEGMVTAAGPGGPDVFLLGIADGGQPGMRVH